MAGQRFFAHRLSIPRGWGRALILVMAVAFLGLVLADRGHRPRSRPSFDEIAKLVEGKTAGQVIALLGVPDTRQPAFVHEERWIWCDFTTLDGLDHPPELRGRVVHLEIIFRDPDPLATASRPHEAWTIDEVQGVSFRLPVAPGS